MKVKRKFFAYDAGRKERESGIQREKRLAKTEIGCMFIVVNRLKCGSERKSNTQEL